MLFIFHDNYKGKKGIYFKLIFLHILLSLSLSHIQSQDLQPIIRYKVMSCLVDQQLRYVKLSMK